MHKISHQLVLVVCLTFVCSAAYLGSKIAPSDSNQERLEEMITDSENRTTKVGEVSAKLKAVNPNAIKLDQRDNPQKVAESSEKSSSDDVDPSTGVLSDSASSGFDSFLGRDKPRLPDHVDSLVVTETVYDQVDLRRQPILQGGLASPTNQHHQASPE